MASDFPHSAAAEDGFCSPERLTLRLRLPRVHLTCSSGQNGIGWAQGMPLLQSAELRSDEACVEHLRGTRSISQVTNDSYSSSRQHMSYSERITQLDLRRPPAWSLLGIGAIAYDERQNRVVIELNAEQRHCHSVAGHPKDGIVQGGIVTGWLDVAMATACLVGGEDGVVVASLEVKVSFLQAAHPGLYRSYGTVIRRGRSIAFMEAELRDSTDVLIATASSTAALRVPAPASG